MDFIFEILAEVFIYGICILPGAFIRWLFLFRKQTFRELLKQDGYTNGVIGFLTIGLITSIVITFIV